MSRHDARLSVAILVVPRTLALDFSIAAQLLGQQDGYEILICADHDGRHDDPATASLSEGVAVSAPHPLSVVADADIVVVPGYDDPVNAPPAGYLDVIRRSADRGARVVAICTGVFALAAAGIMDGRRATTHWQYTSALRQAHPRVDVLENRLFVEDGTIMTCAGAGAGIDACLHLIQSDFGVAAALDVSRRVVASPTRSGTHVQYVDAITPPGSGLVPLRGWMMENLSQPLTLQLLAQRSGMSRRGFIRNFRQETGLPPMRWLLMQRVISARRLLEVSDWAIDKVAAETGFGSAANFRSIFRREVGSTPSAYRMKHRDALITHSLPGPDTAERVSNSGDTAVDDRAGTGSQT